MKRARLPEDEMWYIPPQACEKFTRQVGDHFIARDAHGMSVELKVEVSTSCWGCWYNANSRRCGANYRECGFCGPDKRTDKRSVNFVAVRGGSR